MNRVKYTMINRYDAIRFLIGKSKYKGFPEDGIITGFFHDYTRDALGIYVKSDTFPDVKPGEALEYFEITLEKW